MIIVLTVMITGTTTWNHLITVTRWKHHTLVKEKKNNNQTKQMIIVLIVIMTGTITCNYHITVSHQRERSQHTIVEILFEPNHNHNHKPWWWEWCQFCQHLWTDNSRGNLWRTGALWRVLACSGEQSWRRQCSRVPLWREEEVGEQLAVETSRWI